MWEEKLKVYDKLVAKCPGFERKGKTMLIRLISMLQAKAAEDRGAVGSEYAVILALIAVTVVTAMALLTGAIAGGLDTATAVIS